MPARPLADRPAATGPILVVDDDRKIVALVRAYRVEKSRDRARGGAGIGLAIVRQLVEGWGGHVGAESAAGRTRVWFSLPRG